MRRVFCDAMLKRLHRWLRLCGVDSGFAEGEGKPDEEILRHCLERKLVLLTGDEELFNKAKDYVKCILVKPAPVEEQLACVAGELKITLRKPSGETCPKCLGKLGKKRKKEIEKFVFPRVLASHRDFLQCAGCGAVYWKGTHWKQIVKEWKKIEKQAGRVAA